MKRCAPIQPFSTCRADKAAHNAVWAENRAALQSFYAVHSAQLKAIEQAIIAARKVKYYDRIAKIRNEQKKPLIKEIHQSYAMWLEAKKEINS